MVRLLADENVKLPLLTALRERIPELDVVRAEEIGLRNTPDELILERAAQMGRVVVTHDRKTMIPFGYARIGAGETMPGLILIPWRAGLGPVLDDLEYILLAGSDADFQDQVHRLPL